MSLAPGAESWCLVCGMKDGAVRLFNLLPSGNSWPDDRWGHELGRFNTASSGGLSDQLVRKNQPKKLGNEWAYL